MHILIPVTNTTRTVGPENWRKQLVKELSEKHNVVELKTCNPLKIMNEVINAEIVQSYVASPRNILTITLAKMLGKKIVHKMSGDYYFEQRNKKGFKKIFWIPFNQYCTFIADKVTFPSEYLKNIISKHEPWIRNKSIIIPNGIDLEKINKTPTISKKDLGLEKNQLLLVEVTSFHIPQKAQGIELLVKEFNNFLQTQPKSVLYIIGGGNLMGSYKYKFESNHIKFLGFKENALSYIKSCDLFLHYSYLENFPNVLLEAMACNKPIQTLSTGGTAEMVPSYCITEGPINIPHNFNYNDKIRGYSMDNVAKLFLEEYEHLLLPTQKI